MANENINLKFNATGNVVPAGSDSAFNGINKGLGSATKSSGGFFSSITKIAGGLGVFKIASGAVNVLTNSIGSAITRVDTLNNSNKVFQNMGASASDATKIMKGLETATKGLPTTLDEAAQSTQMLFAQTGDATKSVDAFRAMNDAVIGFGGSSEQAKSAIMQLTQLDMAGPLDAGTWNSLRNNGMTPVLKAMADESGMTMAQLKSAFASGEMTVGDFENKLIELDKNGGGGLVSLQQIAKDSTAGIGTSITIAGTAVVRGMGTIVKAFADAGAGDAIQSVGTAVEGSLGKVGGALSSVLPGIVQGLGEFITQVGEGVGQLYETIKPHIDSIIQAFGSIWTSVQPLIMPLLEFFGTLIAMLAPVVDWVIQFVAGFIEAFAPFVGAFIDALVNIGQFVAGVFEFLSPIISFIAEWVGKIAGFIVGLIGTFLTMGIQIVSVIVDILGPVFDVFVAIVKVAIDIIVGIFNFFKGIFGAVIDFVGGLIHGVFSAAWNVFSSVVKVAVDVVVGVFNFFKGIVQAVIGVVDGILGSFGGSVKGVFDGIGNVLSFVGDLFGSVFGFIANTVQTVWNIISPIFDLIGKGLDAIGGFLSKIFIPMEVEPSFVGGNFEPAFGGANMAMPNSIGRPVTPSINDVPNNNQGILPQIENNLTAQITIGNKQLPIATRVIFDEARRQRLI